MNLKTDIQLLKSSDLKAVIFLLKGLDLPIEDILTSSITFYGLKEAGELIGCAGIEQFSTNALLRSVAIHKNYAQKGLGSKLIDELVKKARGLGIKQLFLLTTTAEGFFTRKGFSKTDRNLVPESVKASKEFSEICSSNALVMTLALG